MKRSLPLLGLLHLLLPCCSPTIRLIGIEQKYLINARGHHVRSLGSCSFNRRVGRYDDNDTGGGKRAPYYPVPPRLVAIQCNDGIRRASLRQGTMVLQVLEQVNTGEESFYADCPNATVASYADLDVNTTAQPTCTVISSG
ncbi:hypothetical protein GWI33_023028 [Rhynchophorus ferrugineus]|uniref:Secreted protein n=1 Tax=Rhynchophorus ferrugineus TaxID=354439 RepID=A0A834M1Y4_RHYFE|nr:hypothetical protein GWI33_023041 [Rhynchophorus ferrugineus]KAF7264586.1 hypothetical protein GWI33_023028 [Rhynchophorus ferrugineus]